MPPRRWFRRHASGFPDRSANLLCAEIESLPFDSESFDAVAATGVLEYADVHRALAELARVLRPGGSAVVSYPNPDAWYGIWKTRVFYPAVQVVKATLGQGSQPAGSGLRLRPAQFIRLLTNSGLEPSSVIPASFLAIPSPLDEWFRLVRTSRADARGQACRPPALRDADRLLGAEIGAAWKLRARR